MIKSALKKKNTRRKNKIMDRTVAIRIEDALHRRIKMRLAENRMSLKDYIVGLIENELKDSKPLILEKIPADNIITEESVKEAQKVVDYVRDLLAKRGEIL